ncbi:3-methyladenine DNA glycosylase-like [Homarus americanus]|uniref:DNA-3-methyladenine glycosylase II n=1 Tax=Homarus americanus TaxID=6706 RepID=A0A8J5N043_HOMAM|nr:3-methyladenine DNA glycosylase-like [Homarus americanus]
MNMKTKEQQRRTHQEAASARKEAEDRQREEEVAQNYKTVLKLLEGVSSKSSSVSISYSDILQECSEKYDNISATDNPTVRVPPLPNKLKLTETDLKAFEDHWKTILEEQEQRVINANEMWDCAKFNIHKGLEALIEGKDALTVLNKDDQDEKESRVTNDPSILLTLENDSFSGGESSDNISDRALEVNGSLTYKWHKVKNDAIKEMQHSPNPHSTEISRSNISVNTAPKNKGKKKMLSNSNSPRSSIHSNRQDKEQPRMYMYYDKDMESKEQHMINKQKKDKVHRENKRRASFTGPSGTQAHSGHYDDSSRGHWYYGAQPMNDCHQPRYANNWSWQQHGNANNIQGQQNNYSFQEMNENDPQVGDFGTSRECGNDQPPHQETYGHGNEYTTPGPSAPVSDVQAQGSGQDFTPGPRLSQDFYDQDSITLAKALLGQIVVRVVDGVRITGAVVETESYLGGPDVASHSHNGREARTEPDSSNKVDLAESKFFWLEQGKSIPENQVIVTKRIGIDSCGEEWANKPLRFYVNGNKCVSVRDKKAENIF